MADLWTEAGGENSRLGDVDESDACLWKMEIAKG